MAWPPRGNPTEKSPSKKSAACRYGDLKICNDFSDDFPARGDFTARRVSRAGGWFAARREGRQERREAVMRRDVKAAAPLVSCGARRGNRGAMSGTFGDVPQGVAAARCGCKTLARWLEKCLQHRNFSHARHILDLSSHASLCTHDGRCSSRSVRAKCGFYPNHLSPVAAPSGRRALFAPRPRPRARSRAWAGAGRSAGCQAVGSIPRPWPPLECRERGRAIGAAGTCTPLLASDEHWPPRPAARAKNPHRWYLGTAKIRPLSLSDRPVSSSCGSAPSFWHCEDWSSSAAARIGRRRCRDRKPRVGRAFLPIVVQLNTASEHRQGALAEKRHGEPIG
jgi:hypothetical protein